LIFLVICSLYINDMPPHSHHVKLALYADDTAFIATSHNPTLLVSYLDSYISDLQRWLREWRIAIKISKSTAIIFVRAGRCFILPRPVTHFGEPIEWVETSCYMVVTLDTRHIWSPHVHQFRKKTAQWLGMLEALLNMKSDLSVRNGVLLYKQFIRPLMGNACLAWRSAARSHVRRFRLLKSKCFRLATGSTCYVSNRHIHEDLSVPLFADHIRALTESFDSRLLDVGNP